MTSELTFSRSRVAHDRAISDCVVDLVPNPDSLLRFFYRAGLVGQMQPKKRIWEVSRLGISRA